VRDVRLHEPAEQVDAVKLRYRSAPMPCTLAGDEVRLREPVLGAAPGQTAVFLVGDRVVGCATITL
jgi:tRNA U34 2-thiouridine synthase MnmA/TrmU